ncbi:FxSxx-COOH system tetratricopeptide repeat protein [Streptomyces sp. NPDC091385]|uniref:FxSxx-COOH system tetratricopeptide repeat protein n=1 Tax=Streptomyces sp. NPDC091385 TaxID=3365997 RepID=UPI003814AF5A
MTSASPEPPPVPPAGEPGHDPGTALPAWTDLADALYLAAYRDSSVPLFDVPGRAALERGERPRERSRQSGPRAADRASPREADDAAPEEQEQEQDGRPPLAPSPEEEEPPVGPAPVLDALPAEERPPLRPLSSPGVPADTGTEAGHAAWPASPRLAGTLALGRSLRPLRLTYRSPHEAELDEEATAERVAATGVWVPVCRPVRERRLDLVLLLDASASMALWSHTARQIAELMEQTAAFRTVRLVRWDVGAGTAAGVRPDCRQLLLAVTDGGHSAWRTGRAASVLHRLGRSSPVAVLSLLPQQLWDLTLPTVARARLRAPSAAAPNLAYASDVKHAGPDPLDPWPLTGRDTAGETAVPVPVVELGPVALGRWARLVAGAGDGEGQELATLWTGPEGDLRSAAVGPVPTRLADLVTEPRSGDTGDDRAAGSSAELRAKRAAAMVRRFRATASPVAYALAQRLAAAPLNLPVMRLLQQSLPDAQPWHLSEILLLGLVRQTGDTAETENVHHVSFDFEGGVREELLALGSRTETVRALREIERHLGPRLEALWGEGAGALVAPEGDLADPPMTEQTRPFVTHLYTALCSVSGPFLARANSLGRLLQRTGPRPVHHLTAATDGAAKQIDVHPMGYSSPQEMRSNLDITPKDTLHYESASPQISDIPNAPPLTGNSAAARPPSAPASPASPSLRQGGHTVSAASSVAPGQSTLPESPRIWGNVPQRNRNFTGRETLLERLRERLRGGIAAVLPEALHGMGGVGKSQIAIEYVYRYSRDYRLIWWIPSEQESQIVQSLIELGERIGLQVGSEMSAVPAVLDALRRNEPYGDWLLVFDNAEDPRTVRNYFPSAGSGSIIVTSRNSHWSTNVSSLEVDVFTREESVALLRRRSQNLPDEAVDHLASALGDLPLAVEQAAVWLAETGMPVQQYLEVYERNFTELMQSDPPHDYNRSVAAAWNVSLGRLRETHPAALQLLQVCAFFAPEPIEWDLFSAVRGISVPPELQSALDEPVKLGRAVREIGRYALARIDHRQNTVLMHRLVQRVLIEQMNAQEQEQMRHAAHQLLAHADPRNPQRSVFWPQYSSLLSHLRASDAVQCKDGWTRRLVLNEVRFLRARGDHATALGLGEEAAAIWREDLGEDHEEVLAVDQQIAETLRERGKRADLQRAYEMQAGLVERYRRVLGEGHEDTLRAQSYLAIHHRNRGHFDEAREMDQQVFDTSTREFGRDDPATLLAAHNYAVSLRLAGSSDQAVELDLDTWERRIEVLGEDHIQTLGTREAYLLDLQEVGRYEESDDGYAALADEVTSRFGEQHPFVALVNRNRCVTLRKMGDHEAAYALSSKYLELIAANLGTDSRHYLLIAASHANDLRQVGKLQESRALSERVLETHRERYGQDHPHSYAIAMNLAVTLRLLGQTEAALELDQASVEGLTRVLGADHPRTLLARMNLGSDHFALGRIEDAHAIDAALKDESARLRSDHPANLAVELNLSHDLKALRRTAESEELYESALDRYRLLLGPSHPATLDAERGLRANGDIDLLSL